MSEFVGSLSTGFVVAVGMFLIFSLMGLLAAVSDWIVRTKEKREREKFLAKYPKPIGKVTGFWVCSYGYQRKKDR